MRHNAAALGDGTVQVQGERRPRPISGLLRPARPGPGHPAWPGHVRHCCAGSHGQAAKAAAKNKPKDTAKANPNAPNFGAPARK